MSAAASPHTTDRRWRAALSLRYHCVSGSADGVVAFRTVAQDAHTGPLRVLKPLYPEGPGICHHVIVHPPGGVVGGDALHVDVQVGSGAHALLTTPGATRFYRSDGAIAEQSVVLNLAAGARLEWLPQEAIAHSGCRASNSLQATLAPGAEMIGWELLVLGLPASGQRFDSGWFTQRLQIPGVWLDSGRIAAADALLRSSPLGLAGHSVLATAWFAAGQSLPAARREALVEAVRVALDGGAAVPISGACGTPQSPAAVGAVHRTQPICGVSAVQPAVVVSRVLAQRVEDAMQRLQAVRAAWRQTAWQMAAPLPRVWAT